MFKFYKGLTFESSIDHHNKEWSKDDPYSFRQWYTEEIQHKDTLLITVGDSWTWGDHLGCIDWDKASDDPVRLEQIFGRKLSEKLQSDWVNLARPGCSNYWMLEKLEDIREYIINSGYKKIYLVVTLTEDLREASFSRRIHVEQDYQQYWEQSTSIQDFLMMVENHLYDKLQTYFDTVPVVPIVSRAFTDSWQHRSWLLDKTWCDVIQEKTEYSNYRRPVPFLAQMAIDPLTTKYISQNPDRKLEFLDMMENVESRWRFLGHSRYNLKGSTYHPNADGHALWADYVFSQL
jgi:hypothetical protein